MAKIPGERKRPEPPRRRLSFPGWLPLAVSLAGVGILLAPETLDWPVRVAGLVLFGGGAFWLGQDRQHDPADRTRISQLESALLRIGILDRDHALRRDVAQAVGAQRGRATAPSKEHGADERDGAGQRRDARARPRPVPDLDAPIPGVDE